MPDQEILPDRTYCFWRHGWLHTANGIMGDVTPSQAGNPIGSELVIEIVKITQYWIVDGCFPESFGLFRGGNMLFRQHFWTCISLLCGDVMVYHFYFQQKYVKRLKVFNFRQDVWEKITQNQLLTLVFQKVLQPKSKLIFWAHWNAFNPFIFVWGYFKIHKDHTVTFLSVNLQPILKISVKIEEKCDTCIGYRKKAVTGKW